MPWSTNPATRRLLCLLIVILSAGWVYEAGKVWLAEHWASSELPEAWYRAAQFEPGNADYWYRLGRYRHLDFAGADLPQAISYYRRAVAIDPRSADYWMDLADAEELAGNAAEAQAAFERAKAVYPISAEVAWRYGNFFLRQGRLDEGLREIRRALESDPRLAGLAVSGCLRAGADPRRVFEEVLPKRVEIYLGALNYLTNEHQTDAAVAAWEKLAPMHPPSPMAAAMPLINQLIEQDRIETAARVWEEAIALAGWQGGAVSGGSLIWDGGFEGDPVGGGFGWRAQTDPHVEITIDAAGPHSGAHAIRLEFDGTTNVHFGGLFQYVAVKPQTKYRFTAWVRTEGITTNNGIRLQVTDPRHESELNLLTPVVTGTNSWMPQQLEFATGSQTHLLQIGVRRFASEKFDNKIAGTAWLDDVSLVPVSAAAGRGAP